MGLGIDEAKLRAAIGSAAKKARKKRGWFKRVDLAEELAGIVVRNLAQIPRSDLAIKIASLQEWAHGHG